MHPAEGKVGDSFLFSLGPPRDVVVQIPDAAVLLHVPAAVHFHLTFPFRLADLRAETFAGLQLCRLVASRSSSQSPKAAPDCGCLSGDCEVLACIAEVVGSRVPTDRADKAQG